jgi:hypothetical protein
MPEEINRLAADQLAELFIDPGLKIDWQLSSPPDYLRERPPWPLFSRGRGVRVGKLVFVGDSL